MMRVFYFILFVPYYLGMLIKSNFIMAKSIVGSLKKCDPPGIIAVDIELESEMGILALVNAITMTPGTLSLDISEDRKKLYIHGMHIESRECFVADIKKLEKRIKRFLK